MAQNLVGMAQDGDVPGSPQNGPESCQDMILSEWLRILLGWPRDVDVPGSSQNGSESC